MRQFIIVAAVIHSPAAVFVFHHLKLIFDMRFPSPQDNKLNIQAHDIRHLFNDQIHAFLPGQTGNNPDHHHIVRYPQPQFFLNRSFVGALAFQHRFRIVMRRQCRILHQIPHLGINSVDDTVQIALSEPQHFIHLFAILCGQNFLRIRRRYGRNLIRENNSGFHEADAVMEAH